MVRGRNRTRNFSVRDFSFSTTNSAHCELSPSRAGRQTAAHGPQDWASQLAASFRRPSAETSPPIGYHAFPLILNRSTSYWLWPLSLLTSRCNTNSLGSSLYFSAFILKTKHRPNGKLFLLEFFFWPCISFCTAFCCNSHNWQTHV